MNVISFENALMLQQLGCKLPAEQSYLYYTEKHREEKIEDGKKVVSSWEEWDKNTKTIKVGPTKSLTHELSDRFYDSWNDALVPAYNVIELAEAIHKINGSDTNALADPDELANKLKTLLKK